MKANTVIGLLLWLVWLPVWSGDGPYAGGPGDGFAQAGLEWEVLATGQTVWREAGIYPSPARAGSEIIAPESEGMSAAGLYGVSGTRVAGLERTGANSWRIPLVPPGLYLIQWQGDQGQRYFSRLVIAAF